MDLTSLLGIAAGTLTTTSFLPQVVKTYRSRHAKDISFFMFLLLFIGIILWVAYGVIRRDMPVILANAVSFVLVSAILFFKIRHG